MGAGFFIPGGFRFRAGADRIRNRYEQQSRAMYRDMAAQRPCIPVAGGTIAGMQEVE